MAEGSTRSPNQTNLISCSRFSPANYGPPYNQEARYAGAFDMVAHNGCK